jgi:drug/metabolite transporter (DMT)-like permease
MVPSLIATLCFALSAVCGHRAARLVGGSEANFWRLVLATFFLGVWAYGFGGGLQGTAFPMFAASGLVGIGIGDVAMFQALPRLGSRLTSLLLQCLSTPFAALIEWLWLGTRLTPAELACDAAILLGVSMALAPGQHLNLAPGALRRGLIFVVVAAVGNALGMVLSRKAYEVARFAGETIDGGTAAFQRILCGALLAGVLLLLARHKEVATHLTAPRIAGASVKEKWRLAWPWVMANSLIGMTIGVSFLQLALKTMPTGIVLPIIAITPLVVIPLAWRMEGEKPTVRALIGGGIAVAGAAALAVVG